MSLHINLYHEVLRQEIQRRRDPLKLSIYALVGIAVLFVGYYMLRFGQVTYLKSQLADKTSHLGKLTAQIEAQKKDGDLATLTKTSDTLMERIEGRFFWAPLFEEIVKISPADVQITSLSGEHHIDDKPGSFILTVTGLAAGGEPRTVAENFRTSLLHVLSGKYKLVSSAFRSLDEATEQVVVNGQIRPAVNFTISIRNNDPSVATAAPGAKP
jgi:hypothetical protein